MELDDCAFPLLAGIEQTDDANRAFDGVNYALLVGSRPRTKGMERGRAARGERRDLHRAGQGARRRARPTTCAILVVGNPANTNCLIAMNNAGSIPRERFTAMMRLDHNRAKAQLAAKCDVPVTAVTNMTIWGNHSATQYPDLVHAQVNGKPAMELVDQTVGRGRRTSRPCSSAAPQIIEARGASSAASAANAAIDHVRDWAPGTAAGDWVSMGVCSDGSYGVPEGLIAGFPVTTNERRMVDRRRPRHRRLLAARIDASVAELVEERDTVRGTRPARVARRESRHWHQDTPYGVSPSSPASAASARSACPATTCPMCSATPRRRVTKRWRARSTTGSRAGRSSSTCRSTSTASTASAAPCSRHSVREVGWGETVSYGELAAMAGRPRAAARSGPRWRRTRCRS